MIKNFLFDLGGVLIDLDVRRSLTAFAQLADPAKTTSDSPITARGLLGGHDSELIDRYQVGAITTDDFINTVLSVSREGTTREQVTDAWFAMLIGISDTNQTLLHALKAHGYGIYVLSNINELHVDWTLAHCPVLKEANGLFFSNEIQMAKPDPRCYSLVLERTGINPAETLYIDDLLPNIEAGRHAGFQTLHVTDKTWQERLMQEFCGVSPHTTPTA
jgi:putative hydrolase of the HAD superfamily